MKHLLSVVLLATSATTFAAFSLSMDGKSTKRVLLCDSTVTTYARDGSKNKTEYTYDEWGNRICILQQSYEDGVWTPQYKIEQTYDQDGNCIDRNEENFRKNPFEEMGAPTDSTITVQERHKPDAIPLGAPKPGFTYDEQGREICHIDYEDTWFFGDECKYKKTEITYDALGRPSYAEYTWKNGAWVGDWKSEYIYDNQRREVCSNYYHWANGAWFVDSKIEYSYDEQGNMTSEIRYGRKMSTTTVSKKDKKGRRIWIDYIKRGALEVQSETNYYYSTHTISIPDTEDDINSISTGKIQASSQGGIITLRGLNEGDTANLYTTDGVLFATLSSTDGQASCAAPSGAHVVVAKIGDESIKISVK